MGEIGERFVDLSSSRYPTPEYFSMVLEYEAIPKWGEIIGDFRKLLSVLAPVKVGIFHLPALRSMDRSWFQDEESGKPEWVDKVLNGDKPDEVVTDIKAEIELNALEHPYPVYLLVLIHTPMGANELPLNGYLLWRETTGKVAVEKLSAG
jgi:hypothetical protein